ncbi:hypothetical protein FRX31_025032 [Thalictrum thalictroides]|uniref:Uncharacterized protein n=1 Tax=Thalictrum thalictroides TaxID=46969 RepID=A0A7J6VLA2_THATH|nr:hypothetical protein FRX31_025032 [Thalictrum thalictroides]
MAFQRSQPSASLPTLSATGVAQPNALHSNASQELEPSLSQPTALEDHELHPKEKLLDEVNPEIKDGRSDAWLKGREHPDGTVLESVQEQYQQVKLANERKRRSSLTEEGMEYYEDMDTDALAEVFGPEKSTRTRGVSSHASKKQLEYAARGKILFQQASSSNSKLEAHMNNVQSQMNKMNDVMMVFINRASGNSSTYAQSPPMTNTPQGEAGSSSVHRSSQQIIQNLMNHFEPASFESRSAIRMMMASTDDATWKEREGTVLALGVVAA